ncbi:MAG TPA: N-acetylmuramoyl-L-alanine amidase [Candidatus Omnitrophota bacterium]|nr:N-acetylmuramoyl-L-alanine amidase [Candidatus Omnitrophota bacterium]
MCEICNNPNHHHSDPLPLNSAPALAPARDDSRRNFLKWIGAAALGLMLPGCTTETGPSGGRVLRRPPSAIRGGPLGNGLVAHVLSQGETVWRVSKMYDVPIEQIIQMNSISDVTNVPKGTTLILPETHPPMPSFTFDQVPLYRNNKWKYIIIHHTASDMGDMMSIDRFHKSRGYHSLGYHFLVGNGSKNNQRLGLIEPGPRWYNQEDGAHTKASNMNPVAIGCSIVGNYSQNYVYDNQLEALAFLVRKLRSAYNISHNRVMPHGGVPGAVTECPGRLFPWGKFSQMIR